MDNIIKKATDGIDALNMFIADYEELTAEGSIKEIQSIEFKQSKFDVRSAELVCRNLVMQELIRLRDNEKRYPLLAIRHHKEQCTDLTFPNFIILNGVMPLGRIYLRISIIDTEIPKEAFIEITIDKTKLKANDTLGIPLSDKQRKSFLNKQSYEICSNMNDSFLLYKDCDYTKQFKFKASSFEEIKRVIPKFTETFVRTAVEYNDNNAISKRQYNLNQWLVNSDIYDNKQ